VESPFFHTRTLRRPIKNLLYLDWKKTDIRHLVLWGKRSCLRSRHLVLWLLGILTGQQRFQWYDTSYAEGKMLSPLSVLLEVGCIAGFV
jgi:hypothetical protein